MERFLKKCVVEAFDKLFQAQLDPQNIQVQKTRREFEGDLTVVVFPLLKLSGKNPIETGNAVGNYLKENEPLVEDFNVVKGFLNVRFSNAAWLERFINQSDENSGVSDKTMMVEYSSPNTNKPLHLGHLRNNFLGYSVAEILKATGQNVIKTQIINDRGIHICKSMLAWKKWGNNEEPSDEIKGDKLVGKYYVIFDKAYKEEIKQLEESGMETKEAERKAPLMLEAQDMLRKWEQGDDETVALWKKMNGWVYSGFDKTYELMGVDFDKLYYESDTYLLGKQIIEEGLEKGTFFKKDDGSIWCDLTDDGLDEKLVLRADGTAVYMTQDIGTAVSRNNDFSGLGGTIYTVGNEQDYHFKVLFLILARLGYSWAPSCQHLSYGMVDLPTGKMKSREGTVVDADDLIHEMIDKAKQSTEELGKLEGLDQDEKNNIARIIALGALKYYLLKVDPKKRMMFNPEESIDFQGNTGPFIQYAHARIRSILRKADSTGSVAGEVNLSEQERELVKALLEYNSILAEAAETLSPSLIANYTYDLVKLFNQFYQAIPILKESDKTLLDFRLALCNKTGNTIKESMALLGIEVPERM